MRPVNLVPLDERRGIAAGNRRNLGAYAIIGALVLVLAAVSAITIFDKNASDRQIELDSLQSQVDAAKAEAVSLNAFTSFQTIHDERIATIDSLAKSRFDWERVMRELAIVIPDRVFLTNLTGTVSPDATVTNGAGLSLRGTIPGPALELTGCAQNQRTVARLIASMHDIDGVGRVLVSTSAKSTPTSDSGSGGGSASGTDTAGCAARPNYPNFQLVAALDGVPTADPAIDSATGVPTSVITDPAAAATTAAPATDTTSTSPTTSTTPTTTTPGTSTTSSNDGGVAAAAGASQDQQTAIAAAQQSAKSASQIPSGGGR